VKADTERYHEFRTEQRNRTGMRPHFSMHPDDAQQAVQNQLIGGIHLEDFL